MRTTGPEGLPHRMAELYSEWLPAFEARKHLVWWWFDGRALERLRLASG